MGRRTLPKPWLDRAPDGSCAWLSKSSIVEVALASAGRCIATCDFVLRFNLCLLLARDRAGELVRMPLGDGRLAICDREDEVWRVEVEGSK